MVKGTSGRMVVEIDSNVKQWFIDNVGLFLEGRGDSSYATPIFISGTR